jgi:hypothetical protein
MHSHTQTYETHSEMADCIRKCEECHHVCTETVPYCLSMGGEHASAAHIGLLLDCAQISQASADFMLRQTHLHILTCGTCAEICDRCADDCERLGPNDAQMQACARVCRECAAACRRMASVTMRDMLN